VGLPLRTAPDRSRLRAVRGHLHALCHPLFRPPILPFFQPHISFTRVRFVARAPIPSTSPPCRLLQSPPISTSFPPLLQQHNPCIFYKAVSSGVPTQSRVSPPTPFSFHLAACTCCFVYPKHQNVPTNQQPKIHNSNLGTKKQQVLRTNTSCYACQDS
jgi:hypothetical protein